MARSTKTPELPANPMPTLTPEALATLINEVSNLRNMVAEQQAALAAKPHAANSHSTKSAENEWKAIKAFAKAGFGKVTPNVDVFTFNRWVEKGFRPMEGSKAVKVNNLRLFHKSQCRPLTKEETTGFEVKAKQKAAKGSAKIVPIGEGARPQA